MHKYMQCHCAVLRQLLCDPTDCSPPGWYAVVSTKNKTLNGKTKEGFSNLISVQLKEHSSKYIYKLIQMHAHIYTQTDTPKYGKQKNKDAQREVIKETGYWISQCQMRPWSKFLWRLRDREVSIFF